MAFAVASIAVFLSGFAALIYQTTWQRLLVLPTGADVYSTTIIVAAFMAGLGVGGLAGGHVADRLTRFQNLWMFVAAECAIGIFGLSSRFVFYDWQYLSLGAQDRSSTAVVALAFGTLLWPTFWMGMSLPVLGRAVSDSVKGAASRVGLLYGLNTLGAATGAYASTWLILPRVGLDGALRAATALNLLAAGAVLAAAVLTWRTLRQPDPVTEILTPATDPGAVTLEGTGWRFSTWAWLYGFAGFQALSLEIVWFRVLGVMMKPSAFTFGTLLAIYLTGLGVGAALASVLLARVRRPAAAFLSLQAFVGLYAAASVAVLTWLLQSDDIPTIAAYLASYEPLDIRAAVAPAATADLRSQFVSLYLTIPVLLVGAPTIAMGASFSLLQKIVLVDLGHLGRRVGIILLANITGSAVGSMLTGWVALNWLGAAASLRLLALASGGFLVLASLALTRRLPRPRQWLAITACALLVAIVARLAPSGSGLWAQLHGSPPEWMLYGEDASGVTLIKTEAGSFGRRDVVYVNGIGQSWIPYGDVHSVLGALPAFIHPSPRRAAVIGLGSGDTVYSLAGRPSLTEITSIEIVRPQLSLLQRWDDRTHYPALTSLLADSRITHVQGDGRTHIMRSRQRFDIIEADALRPTSAYSGNLYSVGYFELMRSRLTDDGLAVSWAPTSRVRDTFASVFPHVLAFGQVIIGSSRPIAFDRAAIRARMLEPGVLDHYARAGLDLAALLGPLLDQGPEIVESSNGRPDSGDLNHDLFPRDEYGVPRRATQPASASAPRLRRRSRRSPALGCERETRQPWPSTSLPESAPSRASRGTIDTRTTST